MRLSTEPLLARASARSGTVALLTKVHLRRLLRSLIRLEIRLPFKTHQAGDQHRGKAAARGVVVLSGQGIVAPGRGQTVFRPGQLVLQLQKAFVGFQLRIIFRNRKKASTRAEQAAVAEGLVE